VLCAPSHKTTITLLTMSSSHITEFFHHVFKRHAFCMVTNGDIGRILGGTMYDCDSASVLLNKATHEKPVVAVIGIGYQLDQGIEKIVDRVRTIELIVS